MSEYLNNAKDRKELLKHLILQLHKGEAPEIVRKRLTEVLQKIPYDEVVEVEQELINEGLPVEEVLRLCDIHTDVLDGHIDQSTAKEIPQGHPVDIFKKENREIEKVVKELNKEFMMLNGLTSKEEIPAYLLNLRQYFNQLMDVDKHYLRKENLLFPFLEKHNITGPPKVMWGKHDETRQLLKGAIEALQIKEDIDFNDVQALIEFTLIPAGKAITDMIMKEEEILFPMAMDTLTEQEWYEINQQSIEIGYCLYSPETEWKPENITEVFDDFNHGFVKFPTGYLTPKELTGIFSKLPVDITFVDKNDKVKFFSESGDRVFHRNKAIINRDVRMCHPPHSVHIVEQILNDFKSGKEDKAPFWINMKGRFIYIVYYAVRDAQGNYLGTLEVTQDLTNARSLEGEKRLLSYEKS